MLIIMRRTTKVLLSEGMDPEVFLEFKRVGKDTFEKEYCYSDQHCCPYCGTMLDETGRCPYPECTGEFEKVTEQELIDRMFKHWNEGVECTTIGIDGSNGNIHTIQKR